MKRPLLILVSIAFAFGAAFMGIRLVKSWNSRTVQQAVQQEQEKWMVDVEKLKSQVAELRDELTNESPQENQAKKVSEILDTPEGIAPDPVAEPPGCQAADKRLLAFFDYLARKHPSSVSPLARFQKAAKALAQTPPEIMEKDLDTLSLFRNIAHLYRTIGAKDLLAFRRWIELEPDAIEAFLPDLFAVLTQKECEKILPGEVSVEMASHYATFFLNTLAGQSYLLRRTSRYRLLATFYAVRILHVANLQGKNFYGVDVKPHILRLQREIALYKGLARQKEYLAILEELANTYQR